MEQEIPVIKGNKEVRWEDRIKDCIGDRIANMDNCGQICTNTSANSAQLTLP